MIKRKQLVTVIPSDETPGTEWKIVLPDGSYLYYQTKKKAKKVAKLYEQSFIDNPPKAQRP